MPASFGNSFPPAADSRLLASPPAADTAVGGVVPFSSVDWPGRLSAVVFIAGCPWRCHYCHNPHLQPRDGGQSWASVIELLEKRRGLLDAAVFSGGEPLVEPHLPRMIAQVRDMGFKVGLHTAGIYPQRLAAVLSQLDWVGLDIKTSAAGYDTLTGRKKSHRAALLSLDALLQSGCDFECRTTWSERWLSEEALLALAEDLAARGVRHYAVQNVRASTGAVPEAVLSEATQRWLATRFEKFSYR